MKTAMVRYKIKADRAAENVAFITKVFERLKREVPLGRLAGAREDAEFAAYLCSDPASCFVGQVFPVCGGWVAR